MTFQQKPEYISINSDISNIIDNNNIDINDRLQLQCYSRHVTGTNIWNILHICLVSAYFRKKICYYFYKFYLFGLDKSNFNRLRMIFIFRMLFFLCYILDIRKSIIDITMNIFITGIFYFSQYKTIRICYFIKMLH